MEATQVSTKRWMEKEVVHIYNGKWLSHKKNEILTSAKTWLDLEGIVLSEIIQTEEDKCHMISLICGIWKTNRQAGQKQTHKCREQAEGVGGQGKKRAGIKNHKWVVTE